MLNIVPPGSSTIAGGPCWTPGILDFGESAQSKPAFEALAKLAGTVELDMARADRGFHGGLNRSTQHFILKERWSVV
jgi:hypothetical protein